jgi:hypothetical protein
MSLLMVLTIHGGKHRVGGALDDGLQRGQLLGAKFAQHMAHHAFASRTTVGGGDADLEARELIAAEGGNEGADAVVARCGAAGAETQASEREIDIVVNHERLHGRGLVKMTDGLGGTTAVVHEGERFEQMAAVELRHEAGPALFLAESGSQASRDFVQHHKSNVVTCVAVGFAGIAEADNEARSV